MALTPKQESFCLAYLETGNASEAYRRSYSAGGMKPESVNRKAKEVLDNVNISARLDELTRKATSAAVMTKQRAMERLSLIAETNVTDVLEFDQHDIETADGMVRETIWRMKDSDEVKATASVAIKSVTMTKFGPKIEMHDKLNAMKQLAEMQGWNAPEKKEITGANGGPIQVKSASDLTDAELAALVASDK